MPQVIKGKFDVNTFFGRAPRIDAELWPEVQDQVTALLEQQEFVNSFPVNYVIKTVKGSTKDLKQFQDDEWLVAGNHQKKVKM